MKAFLSIFGAVAMAFALLVPAATKPASAQTAVYSDLVQTVGHRRSHYRDWRHSPRRYHRDRYYGHRYRRGPSVDIIIGGGVPYYRPGPRYIAPPVRPVRPAYGGGRAHVDWCYARYRSYRAYDNTFQPYNGPRRACVSPYY